MKKILILGLLLISFQSIYSQIDVAGGMGISFVYNPSLNDYIDYNWSAEEVQPFSTMVEFYGEIDYSVSKRIQIGAEYVYSLWGYNTSTIGGSYNIDYTHHKPSFLAYYVITGEGYKFKFGAGAGVRILNLTENITVDEDFSTIGFGVLVRAQGHTKLSDNFYANIGTTVRYDAPGEPESNGGKLTNSTINKDVNINSFSVSVNIGISYFF